MSSGTRFMLRVLALAVASIVCTVSVSAAYPVRVAAPHAAATASSTSDTEANVAFFDGDGNDASSIAVDIFFRTLKVYIEHHEVINASIADTWHRWQLSRNQTTSSADVNAIAGVLVSTPYLSVLGDSPCGGRNTVKVQYRKDGSRDCVDLESTRAAQFGGATLLFVGTVDGLGHPNNSLVYQLRSDTNSAEFLGTVTYVGHPAFRMDFLDGVVRASYDNRDGTRTTCYIDWVRGKYAQKCL